MSDPDPGPSEPPPSSDAKEEFLKSKEDITWEVDQEKAATQKLYLMLPNHKCPNKKGCPFHPPDEEDEEEEEVDPSIPVNRRRSSAIPQEISEELLAEKLAKIHKEFTPEKSKSPAPEKIPSPVKTPEKSPTPEKILTPERSPTPEKIPTPKRSPTPEKLPTPEKTPEREPSPFFEVVGEAPVFVLSLEDMTVKEGRFTNFAKGTSHKKVHFNVQATGNPLPTFTWLKDGSPLDEDDHRFSASDYKGEATLTISNLKPSDAGRYTCKAENSLGESHTAAQLTIEEVRHRRMKVQSEEPVLPLPPRTQKENDFLFADRNISPQFTLPLVDQSRAVGEHVTFTVTVTCRPEPTVTWYLGEEEVPQSDRVTFEHEFGVYRLVVRELGLWDAGEWRCHAVNDYGEAWCSAQLNVIESIPLGSVAPVFKEDLRYTTVSEGSLVRLECVATGEPMPEMKWFKNRNRIDNDGHYKIRTTEGGLSVLTIARAEIDDSGDYMCQAVNEAGSVDTEARMRVQKVVERDSYTPLPESRAVSRARDSRSMSRARPRQEVAPSFTAKLQNKKTSEGASARLGCSVTGIPEPEIHWFKDGREIYDGSYYTMRNNYGLLSLEIVLCKPSLAGKYSVECTNSEGSVTCSCLLDVEAEEAEEEVHDILRPKFVTQIETVKVNEGEDAVFECMATGKPMPTFKWQRDMMPLSGSKRVEIEYDNQGHATLTIKKVKASDEGLYYCMAVSRAGRVKCSARLQVKAKSPSPCRPDEYAGYTSRSSSVCSMDAAARRDLGAPAMFALMLPHTLDCVEGDRLRLDCSVMGYPTPLVTWHKADRELVYSQRHRIMLCGTLHTMEIPSAMTRDKGEYIVRATNIHGTVECVCTVDVKPRGTRLRSPPDYRREAMREAAKLSTCTTPFFIKHLPKTIDVMAGIDVRLDCIMRRGIELVRWSQSPDKEDKEKTAKKELEEEGFEGEFIPTTKSPPPPTPPRDPASLDTTPADAASRLDHPSFSDTPKDLVRPVGGEAIFECTTAGTSAHEVKWYKDGRLLIKSDAAIMTLSGNRHRLRIPSVLRSDQGEYTCKMRSPAFTGSRQCAATLTVTEDSPTSLPPIPQIVVEEESKQQYSTTSKENVKEERAYFTQTLPGNTEVMSGQDVSLTCRVKGQVTKVVWEVNNKPLPKEARYFVSYDKTSDLHTLTLTKTTDTDSANYSCVAQLPDRDHIVTQTQLLVKTAAEPPPSTPPPSTPAASTPPPSTPPPSTPPLRTPPSEEETEFPPEFIKALDDVIIRDGEPLVLRCEISGNPRPQIAWYRDGVELFDSQDIQMSQIGPVCELSISDIFPEDEGDYSCTATNSLGEATVECYVVVDAPSNA